MVSDFNFDRDSPNTLRKAILLNESSFNYPRAEIEEFKNETEMNNNGELPLQSKSNATI